MLFVLCEINFIYICSVIIKRTYSIKHFKTYYNEKVN